MIEYGQTTIKTSDGSKHQVEVARDGKHVWINFTDASTFYASDWHEVENDVRELLGLPKHRTRKAKDGGK